jgi:hypothetical protein
MSRVRLNIVDLKKNHPEQFGRFVMALKNLEDSDDWYRICGIHGNTFRPDDDEVRCPTDPNVVKFVAETGEPVYCKHSVYSFIAWHTPYLYQFELLLNKYNNSGNDDYIALPYIDLTEGDDLGFMNDSTITIFYQKRKITIDNPLAGAYYYPNGIKTKTTRKGFLSPRTEKERKQLHTVKRQLNNVMYAPVYELFSSHPVSYVKTGEITKYTPLETPHNSIHDIIGGGGNMSDISISAFDPIFWLHHCNMDRHFYSWVHANTDGFKDSLYPGKITKPIYEATLAPFFKQYPYGSDAQCYRYGWQNAHPEYLLINEMLDMKRYRYSYDLIKPRALSESTGFVELIDIPIPQETVSIDVYLRPNSEPLDRDRHFAGSAVWFGLNRATRECGRCRVTRTNLKIEIGDYLKENSITQTNFTNYTLVIEGTGRLILGSSGYKQYMQEELIRDGSVKLVLA